MAFWNRKPKQRNADVSVGGNDAQNANVIKAMSEAIGKQEASDPLVRAKITAKDLTSVTLNMLQDDRGVRIETALGVLCSLAGASCSYAMLDLVKREPERLAVPEVMIMGLKSGEQVMFGDYLNRKLVEGEQVGSQTLSLWHLFAGITQLHLGEMPVVDWKELFERVASQGGKPEFGTVNVPERHLPGDLPQNFVERLFPQYLPILARYDLPRDQYWLALGLSAQDVMGMAKDTTDLNIMTQLAMECAVYGSKIDMTRYIS